MVLESVHRIFGRIFPAADDGDDEDADEDDTYKFFFHLSIVNSRFFSSKKDRCRCAGDTWE